MTELTTPKQGAATNRNDSTTGDQTLSSTPQAASSSMSWRALGAFCLGAIVIVAALFFPRDDPIMIITAETRGLQYQVANVETSHIFFRQAAALIPSMGAAKQCVVGLLEPGVSSNVSYSIFDQLLLIEIEAEEVVSAQFRTTESSQRVIAIENGGSISYGPGTGCPIGGAATLPVRLPIWGATELGRSPLPSTIAGNSDPFNGLLVSGKVSVFGQKIVGTGIYPAGEFDLPSGARLSGVVSSDNSKVAPWWGFATYVPNQDHQSLNTLSISASTTTESLNVSRQAGPGSEKIEAGSFNHISGEPWIAQIIALLVSLFFLSEFILAMRSIFKR